MCVNLGQDIIYLGQDINYFISYGGPFSRVWPMSAPSDIACVTLVRGDIRAACTRAPRTSGRPRAAMRGTSVICAMAGWGKNVCVIFLPHGSALTAWGLPWRAFNGVFSCPPVIACLFTPGRAVTRAALGAAGRYPVQHLRAQRQGVDLLQGVILSTEHLGQIGPRPRTGNQRPDRMQGLTRWASGDRLPNAAGRRIRYNGASHAPSGRNVHSRPLDLCGDPAPASHPRVPRPLFVSRARG